MSLHQDAVKGLLLYSPLLKSPLQEQAQHADLHPCGFCFLKPKTSGSQPLHDQLGSAGSKWTGLMEFLLAPGEKKPVCITFGSMQWIEHEAESAPEWGAGIVQMFLEVIIRY